MNKGIQSEPNPTLHSLTEFLAGTNIPLEIFARVSEQQKDRIVSSTVLISLDHNFVIRPLLDKSLDFSSPDIQAEVWRYTDWRAKEASKMSNVYDMDRFTRSTELKTLCRKVSEHAEYSFIARVENAMHTYCVIKYTFVRITPDARLILASFQDITKSLEHDILTGGLNREGLLSELKHKFEHAPQGSRYSVVCFNIKNFRIINEMHGSAVGDKVLQHMYTSIVYSDLSPISYARYEADTFICLVNRDSIDTDVITRLCMQVCNINELKVAYRCLCGICHVEDLSMNPVDLCSHAKLAITFIKDQYITPWVIFDKQMQQTAISDSEVLAQIDEAIANKELMPYFQPVVNLQTGRIEMAEALVRWKSKKHGMISPASFVPVLERNGGLSRIDKLMEQTVFSLQRHRLENGLPTVPIDLNLSWTDFADTNLISQLQTHILDKSVPTDLIRYEITESAYEEIAENRMDMLTFFENHDVKLLVDDFGQGYSFGTMKNVDFQIVKLDKSMIDKLGQSRKMDLLVKMLISVFHSLNSKVVAEGVEDENQVKYLKEIGCDYIQGFYFYRPMDEESFLSLIERQNTTPQQVIEEISDSEIEAMSAPVVVDREVLEEQNARLRQSLEEAKCLRMLLDEQEIHYFEWNIRTHEDIASDKFVKMYGLPSNVIPNMPEVAPLCLEEDLERFRAFYDRAARGEKMGSDCFRLYKPDGKGYTWYRKTFYTLFDDKGLPYKAVITMQDCQDEYRYRMLRTRDRMLTLSHEIVTFIYTLNNDTITITFLNHIGEVSTASVENFLQTPVDRLLPDQAMISNHLRKVIEEKKRTGYFDFTFTPIGSEYRAHYAMVDGEYGHLYAIIGQAEDINKTRERLNAKEQLLKLSEIDGLTQTYNRSAGEQRMSALLAKHQSGVFGVLDCDKFKNVNDTFGHVVGDSLLVSIAKIMKDGNPNGICMRLGGDEFAFFVAGNTSAKSVEADLNHFYKEIDSLQVPGMGNYRVSVSVGAVIYDGKSDVDFDALYRKADKLLYQSKKYKGNKTSIGKLTSSPDYK